MMNQGPKPSADSPNVWGDETDNIFDFDISTVAVKPQEPHVSPSVMGRASPPGSPVFRFLIQIFPLHMKLTFAVTVARMKISSYLQIIANGKEVSAKKRE